MKKYILITILLTALLALNGCMFFTAYKVTDSGELQDAKEVFVQNENETDLDETVSHVSEPHKFTVETYKGELKADDGTILATYDYSYPVFECNEGDNEEYIATINKMFKDNALGVANRAEDEYETLLKMYEVEGPFIPYNYRYGYGIHTDAKGIISITETQYAYLGGAHGMAGKNSYTFDVANGKELSLSDLLYGTEDEIVEAFAKEFVKVSDMFYPGDDPAEVVKKEFPYAEYYVDADGVTAYFQEYHVGPYSSGFVFATISDKEMLKIDFSDTAEQ